VPQVPLLQAPVRHWLGAAQAPPVNVPQRPSGAQVPERQAAARAQDPPMSSFDSQVPPEPQKALVAHWASVVQALEQLPATQAPPRQLAPVMHAVPSVAPHWPSEAHTPETHWSAAVHGR
jgi:hypothetical protein